MMMTVHIVLILFTVAFFGLSVIVPLGDEKYPLAAALVCGSTSVALSVLS